MLVTAGPARLPSSSQPYIVKSGTITQYECQMPVLTPIHMATISSGWLMLRLVFNCVALHCVVLAQTGSLLAQENASQKQPALRLGSDSFAHKSKTATAGVSQRFPIATPESVGIQPGALNRLSELVNGFVECQEIVGAELLVIKKRRTVLHEAFGHDHLLREKQMKKNTIFSIRSMTKPLLGVLAQILIDEGTLEPNAPVAKYLEAFDTDASRNITLRHLLTHRSGLPMRSAGKLWSDYGSFNNVKELADYWGNYGPQLFEPGTQYHYADANVDTLAAVIESATTEAAEVLIQRRLLAPLGMKDTISLLQPGDPRVTRVATKHIGGRGRWRPFWTWSGRPYFAFPMFAQGFYSTVIDYACFLTMLADDGVFDDQQLVSREAIQRILTPASVTTMPTGVVRVKSSYGQLMHLYEDRGEIIVFGHSGSDGTYAWVWPAEELIVLYFTQSRGSTTMTRMEAVLDSLLGRPLGTHSHQ